MPEQIPQQPSLPEKSGKERQVLNFEEFRRRGPRYGIPRYNNFFLFFAASGVADSLRNSWYYQKFASEYPDMAKSLCDKIQNLDKQDGIIKALEPHERELYDAYVIMSGYGVPEEEFHFLKF